MIVPLWTKQACSEAKPQIREGGGTGCVEAAAVDA